MEFTASWNLLRKSCSKVAKRASSYCPNKWYFPACLEVIPFLPFSYVVGFFLLSSSGVTWLSTVLLLATVIYICEAWTALFLWDDSFPRRFPGLLAKLWQGWGEGSNDLRHIKLRGTEKHVKYSSAVPSRVHFYTFKMNRPSRGSCSIRTKEAATHLPQLLAASLLYRKSKVKQKPYWILVRKTESEERIAKLIDTESRSWYIIFSSIKVF